MMSDTTEWVQLASFNTGLEADIVRVALEAEEIPVLVKGDQPGIFGASYQGVVTGGVALFVPDTALVRARELMPER
jgi:hypothetical protein